MNKKTRFMSWSLSMAIAFTLILSGCFKNEPEPGAGKVSFAFNSSESISGRTMAVGTPAFVKYVIKNEVNETITDEISVFKFGSSYTSEPQTMSAGNYELLEYYILNSEKEIVYAAVVQGSPLASLVSKTLPMNFQVAPEETTYVNPDVLPVTSDTSPEDFGYVKWGFNIAAQWVKFILPVHPILVNNFKSATLTVTQGGYTHTELMKGSPSTQIYTSVLVKTNTDAQITVTVDADNVYSGDYPMETGGDVDYRTSVSRMEYNNTITSVQNNEVTLEQFKHKIGKGWDFKYAEITTHALNGSWIKMKYEAGQYCNRYVTLTTNASSFVYDTFGDMSMRTDKIVWSQPSMYKDGDKIIMYNTETQTGGVAVIFGEPVCTSNECTLTGDLSLHPSYTQFVNACNANDWKMFDALTKLGVIYNGQTSYVTSYFKIEKDVENAYPARKIIENNELMYKRGK